MAYRVQARWQSEGMELPQGRQVPSSISAKYRSKDQDFLSQIIRDFKLRKSVWVAILQALVQIIRQQTICRSVLHLTKAAYSAVKIPQHWDVA